MLEMLGETLPLAIGMALSPFPIIAVLLLNSPHSPASAPAFLAGRLLSVIVLVAIFAALADYLEVAGEASTLVSVVRILVGIALVGLAARKWIKRPGRDDDVELPRWMATVDGARPGKSFGLAVLLSVANVKELLFSVGAGATIGSANLGLAGDVVAAVIFGVVASSTVAVPVIAVLVAPERMRGPLDRAKDWLVRNNGVIIGVVLLLIGASLIGGGLGSLNP
ncbi:GAP family protein [Leifsonia kafniensis]|uniref:GAP family protein n=1 Tax=Leifsonia kafniensis TaxID=475957 RepID=A0ABP7KIS2_9MICO